MPNPALALRPATAPAKKPRRKGLVIASITVMSVRNLQRLRLAQEQGLQLAVRFDGAFTLTVIGEAK